MAGPRPFLLFEILLVFAFVALGMLGTALVTLKGMAHARDADLHGVAAQHASRLAWAMRANRGYWADAAISPCFSTGEGGRRGCVYLAVPSPARQCSGCTAQARAISDLGMWRDSLQKALPRARLDVECLGGAVAAAEGAGRGSRRSCSIRIAWAGEGGRGGPPAGEHNTYMVRVTP